MLVGWLGASAVVVLQLIKTTTSVWIGMGPGAGRVDNERRWPYHLLSWSALDHSWLTITTQAQLPTNNIVVHRRRALIHCRCGGSDSPRVIGIVIIATSCSICSGNSLGAFRVIVSEGCTHYLRVVPFESPCSLLDARGASKAQPDQTRREFHATRRSPDQQQHRYQPLRPKNEEECRSSAC